VLIHQLEDLHRQGIDLIREVRAVVEKMATVKEAKKAGPPDVLPSST
jgi:hypothetical protein